MTSDPRRLLDDDATEAELRALRAGARDDPPTPGALDRREPGVTGAFAPGGGGPGPAASGAAKLAIGVASLTGIAAAITIAVAVTTGAPRASAPPPSPALEPPPLEAPSQTEPEPSSAPAIAPPPPEVVEAEPTPRSAPRDTGMDELTLVTTAQSSLASSPSRALALAEEHARRFPEGALAQEREVVAITALLHLHPEVLLSGD